MIDYYAILGVPQHAKEEQIRTAFRMKAKTWHPDVCPEPDAHERFIVISKAYNTLIDPTRRARYDEDVALARAMQVTPVSTYSPPPGLQKKFVAGLVGTVFLIVLSLAIAGLAIPVALPSSVILFGLLMRKTKLIGIKMVATYTILTSGFLLGLLLLVLGLAYLSS